MYTYMRIYRCIQPLCEGAIVYGQTTVLMVVHE